MNLGDILEFPQFVLADSSEINDIARGRAAADWSFTGSGRAAERLDPFTQKGSPLSVTLAVWQRTQQWGPTRPGWTSPQADSSLLGRSPTLPSIAGDAAADDVAPGRGASLRSRNDVIEIELRTRGTALAILAGVAITREHIGPAESHLAPGHAIEVREYDDPGDRNRTGEGSHDIDRLGFSRSIETPPCVEIECFVVRVDRSCAATVDEREGSAYRCDVDRKERTIQYEYARVQYHSDVPNLS